MMNAKELRLHVNTLKAEMIEAVAKGNDKAQNNIVNEIFRLESVLRENERKVAEQKQQEELAFDKIEQEEALNQEVIIKSFRALMKKVFNNYANSSSKEISDRQKETILSGLKDRIGLDITQDVIKFIVKFNYNQATELISRLQGISFYNQRIIVTQAVKTLSTREDYVEILENVKSNIHKREWFEANKDLLQLANELQPPTEAQARRIVNVARYPETHVALKEMGIDVNDYEYRKTVEGSQQLHYSMNWDLLKKDIVDKFNRESASNFIQTYDYITNFYEGRNLEAHERNHLRSLYIRLGEYECTRPSYLNTILKEHYTSVVSELEHLVRMEQVINTKSHVRFREALLEDKKRTKREAREVRSLTKRTEIDEAREFTSFIFNIYAVIGQEVPEEMSGILPYFVQGGECKYATVEPIHYAELRKLVFEQREVIKEVRPEFNWGAFIFNQPTHVLKALGLDMMI